jgi:hypothetical protein
MRIHNYHNNLEWYDRFPGKVFPNGAENDKTLPKYNYSWPVLRKRLQSDNHIKNNIEFNSDTKMVNSTMLERNGNFSIEAAHLIFSIQEWIEKGIDTIYSCFAYNITDDTELIAKNWFAASDIMLRKNGIILENVLLIPDCCRYENEAIDNTIKFSIEYLHIDSKPKNSGSGSQDIFVLFRRQYDNWPVDIETLEDRIKDNMIYLTNYKGKIYKLVSNNIST